MALNDCQRRFRENNCRINVYLYGNLNGINVTFGVTVVPIQNLRYVSEHLPNRESEQKAKFVWHLAYRFAGTRI